MPALIPTDGISAIPVKLVSPLSAQYWNAIAQQTEGPVLPVKNATNLIMQSSGNLGSYFYAVCDGQFFYLIDEIVEESAKKFSAMVYSGTDYTLGSGVEIDVDAKGAVIDFSEKNYDWTLVEPAQLKLELWTITPTTALFDTIILDREYWDDGSRKYYENVPMYIVTRPAKDDYYPPWEIWSAYMGVTWYSGQFGKYGNYVQFGVSTKWQWDQLPIGFQGPHIANAHFERQKAGHPWPHCTGIFDFLGIGGSFGGVSPNMQPYVPDGSYLKVYPLGFLP